MASLTPNFKGQIFRYNQPLVIAGNRNTALIYGLSIRYNATGYQAGTVLARNTTDGIYQAYDSGGSSGTNVASAILLDAYAPEDFTATSATGTTLANGLFGGATVYKDSLPNYSAGVLTDLKASIIYVDGGTQLLKF